jgi:hypothetical protein
MAKVIVSKSKLDSIADAVASVSGAQTPLTLDDVVTEVGGLTKVEGTITINVNGSIDVTQYAEADVSVPTPTPSLQDKTVAITPTTSAQTQTVTADSGYDGLDEVTINTAAVPTGSAKPPTTISGSGATVTPGTNTIALSKTVNVTPRVTEGYISQGTQDSVLVYLNANVPTRDSSSMQVSGSTVTAPSGYYSEDASVTVAFPPSVTVEPLSVTENGTYSAPSGKAYSPVTVNVSGGGGYTMGDIAERNMLSGTISGNASFIASYAFYRAPCVSAIFPHALSIGESAFAFCSNLLSVDFQEATLIGTSAFGSCSSLRTINIPKVEELKQYAFYRCVSLAEASAPEMITIGASAFNNCASLSSISFPKATFIGDNAFYNCSKLKSADFPLASNVKGSAFYNCFELSAASFPKVQSIGAQAFRSCRKLLSLYLTGVSSVPTLGNSAFMSSPIGGSTASTGGVYGSVFVPASLYNAFKTATNWSSISARLVSV